MAYKINSKKLPGDLRDFPYPYCAMMSICSDLDETPNIDIYLNTSKYLNTDKITPIGQGVNLEVGNTIYFDMPKEQFSYCNTDEKGREKIHKLIRSGHIDAIHSFGDFTDTREKIIKHLSDLVGNDCHLKVWVDHAVAPSNFGADIMMGKGDDLTSPVYHADITLDYGIKYVWTGRVTSLIGQGVKRSYKGIANSRYIISSTKTIAKEIAKVFLAKAGFKKYRLHERNQLITTSTLRSGQSVKEFIRCNPYWGGVSGCETAYGIKNVLRKEYLDELINSRGFSIMYTHLGKIKNEKEPFDEETRKSFQMLSEYNAAGRLLVTTTRRLLDYYSATRNLKYSANISNGRYIVDLKMKNPIEELSGITIYIPNEIDEINDIEVRYNSDIIDNIKMNEQDETGLRSVSVAWEKLQYPL